MRRTNLTRLGSPETGLFGRISNVLTPTLRALTRAYRVRRDTRHLSRFNDHLLRDVGITRSEIEPPYPEVWRP